MNIFLKFAEGSTQLRVNQYAILWKKPEWVFNIKKHVDGVLYPCCLCRNKMREQGENIKLKN